MKRSPATRDDTQVDNATHDSLPHMRIGNAKHSTQVKSQQKRRGRPPKVERSISRRTIHDSQSRCQFQDHVNYKAPTTITSPILLSGNSDPFNSTPSPVTSQVNQVIVFARDQFLLASRRPRHLRKDLSRSLSTVDGIGREPILQTLSLAISHADTFTAFIACYAVCLQSLLTTHAKHTFEPWALDMKGQALHRLQRSMKTYNLGTTPDMSTIFQVLFMFQCECHSRNRNNAAMHASILRSMVDSMEDSEIKTKVIVLAMHDDVELASFQLQQTLFDPTDWYSSIMQSSWNTMKRILPSFPPEVDEMPKCIAHPAIQRVLINLRKSVMLGTFFRSLKSTQYQLPYIPHYYRWWATSIAGDLGTMLNLSLKLSTQSDSPSQHDRLLSAAIAFTVFCSMRKYLREGVFDNIDPQDASHVLAPKLRLLLEQVLDSSSRVEALQESEVMFWMFFTGALFEQTSCRFSSETGGEHDWFTEHLCLQAKELGVYSWVRAERVLNRFVLGDCIEPHPSLWYGTEVYKRCATIH